MASCWREAVFMRHYGRGSRPALSASRPNGRGQWRTLRSGRVARYRRIHTQGAPGAVRARQAGFVFKGAEAVVFAAGSSTGQSSEIDPRGVRKTLGAAKKAGVKRYLAISSIGASTGMKLSGAWATDEMKDYYKHKRLAGKAIM